MLFVFDKTLRVIHTTADPKDLIAGEVNEQINGEHSCSLTIPWTADTQTKFAEFNHIGFYLNNRFEVYKIRQTTDIKKGDAERDLYCEHLSYELSDSIVEDKRVDNGPARDIITRILSDTDWEVGNIADLGNKTYNAYYITHREALYEIAELYGGELQFRIELDEEKKAIAHKYVDLLTARGEDTGIRFTFDRNLEEIQRDTDTLEIRTCLIGRGHSPQTENGGQQRRIQFTDVIWRKADGHPVDKPAGQNWVGHPDAIAKYGVIKGVYEDESETPEQLLQNTWNALQQQCEKTQTYKAKLLFLQELMGDKEVLRLGDHFTIIDDEIGVTMNTRIIEIKYDLQDITNSEATMGQFYKTNGDNSGFDKLQSQIDNIRDTIGNIEIGDVNIDDGSFPDTVPPKSTVTTKGLFASIQIDWTYVNRTYYEYALYGSQTKGFAPAQQNLLYRGRGSSFLHSVQPDQTWYYRVCAYNSHGNRNEFSDEVKGYSAKIANAEDYMASASIGSALIGSLNADVINSGKIKAQHIEMKGVSVTDGNGTKTLDINSAGQVSMNVSSLKINSKAVATEEAVQVKVDNIQVGVRNYLKDTLNPITIVGNGETNQSVTIGRLTIPCAYLDGKPYTFGFKYRAVGGPVTGKVKAQTGGPMWLSTTDAVTITANNQEGSPTKTSTMHLGGGSWTTMQIRCDELVGTIEIYDVYYVIGNKDAGYTPAPEDIEGLISDVQGSLDDFENTVNTTFKDNIIDQAEAVVLKQELTKLDADKKAFDQEYSYLSASTNIPTSIKDNLASAKSAYDSAYNSLVSFINSAIANGVVGDSESQSVASAFNTYNTTLASYRKVIQTCMDSISTDKIDKLQVGGRNYLRDYMFQRDDVWRKNKNSEINTEEGYGALLASTANPWLYQVFSKDEFKPGQEVTVQYEIKCEGVSKNTGSDTMLIRTQLTGYETATGGHVKDVCVLGKHENEASALSEWTKCTFTGTLTSDFGTANYVWFRLYARNFTGKIYFRNVMLEKGNKASTPCPAPEDYESLVDRMQATIMGQVNEDIAGLQDQNMSILNRFDIMFSDGIITANEKVDLAYDFAQITSQYETMKSMVEQFNDNAINGQMTLLTNQYNLLKQTMDEILKDMNSSSEASEREIYAQIEDFVIQYNHTYLAIQTYVKGTLSTVNSAIQTLNNGIGTTVSRVDSLEGTTNTLSRHFNFTDTGWVEIFASINGVPGRFKTQISDQKLAFLDSGNEVAYLSNQELYITRARILQSLQIGNISMQQTSKGGLIFQ